MQGQILVVSGPSGSGKSTLLNRLLKEERDLCFSISSTTRAIRDGEKEGVDYYFISEDEFKKGIENGEFLEWAQVHKNFYGTSLKPVLSALNDGKIVIFDIDVQGFHIALEKFRSYITSIFITTTNKKELKRRLQNRGTDNAETIENRLMNAVGEMEHILEYDYFLINDDIEKSYRGLKSVVHAMRLKSANINLRQTVDSWIDC
ncbi:guanylate kinase [Campylobacter curvus]|uniref:guanylate kinase n=1 Tax=Campylobacter curvus TaxID=200 RepID=UPI0014705BBF|nr:guanylate kinase [Campylobacter curvus]